MSEPNLNPRPRCFVDKKGRTYDLTLDFAVCRRVDAFDKTAVIKEPFSLLAPEKSLLHKLLYTERASLFAVIWAIVVEDVTTAAEKIPRSFPISPKEDPEGAELEFLSGVNGPVIEAARQAFSEALADFFPELQIVLSTWATQAAMVQKKVGEKMQAMQPMVEEMVEMEFNKHLEKMKNDLKTRSAKPGESPTVSPPSAGYETENSSPPATPSNVSF